MGCTQTSLLLWLTSHYLQKRDNTCNTHNTRKYQSVDKVPRNFRSNNSTLLPDPNPPTRLPYFFSMPHLNPPDIEEKNYAVGPALYICVHLLHLFLQVIKFSVNFKTNMKKKTSKKIENPNISQNGRHKNLQKAD